jgi:methylenetetrahydrofolate reductase (NADPH)
MRKFHEIRLFLDWAHLSAPVIGNVYVLNKTVARMFNQNKIPGCVVSDALYAQVEKYAAGPDKGKAFFTELAAKQLAVFKGMGFAAGYLGGVHKAETFAQIIDLAESFGANDWKEFAKEIQYPKQDEFYLFEQDPQTGLGDGARLNAAYLKSLAEPAKAPDVSLTYRFTRLMHGLAFTPGKKLFPAIKQTYARLEEGKHDTALKALHGIEHVSKTVMFGCKDCGDCSLPDTGYFCPRASCSKTQRNGPCGGSSDGRCELDDKECIWARAYDRLKYYGESQHMIEGPAVFANPALSGTSGWANNFLGRDHHHVTPPAPPPAANGTPPKPAAPAPAPSLTP